MGVSNVRLLYIINFLYFTASGIAFTVITHHIAKHGGNHMILGSLVSLVNLSVLISRDFVALFENSKRFSLKFCLWSALFSFFLVTISSAWYVSYFARIFYALTLQVLSISKELVAKNEQEDTRITSSNILDSMRVVGLIVGSISGGYIYTYTKKFSTNCGVSCGILVAALLLACRIDEEFTAKSHKPEFFELPSICLKRIKNLTTTNYSHRLDLVLLKLLYIATITIFYSRYTFIAGFNYRIKSIAAGYLKSYNYLLIYISGIFAPFILEKIPKKNLCEFCMMFCGVTLVGLCYAPHLQCFLFFFIFVMFFYSIVNLLLQQDALHLRLDEKLNEAVDTIAVILKIVEPFIYGVILYFFGGSVYKFSMILPAMLYTIILHRIFWCREIKRQKVLTEIRKYFGKYNADDEEEEEEEGEEEKEEGEEEEEEEGEEEESEDSENFDDS